MALTPPQSRIETSPKTRALPKTYGTHPAITTDYGAARRAATLGTDFGTHPVMAANTRRKTGTARSAFVPPQPFLR